MKTKATLGKDLQPLFPERQCQITVILEISLSPAEAVADEEEYFDVSADSLEASYKRIKLNSSLSSIDSNPPPQQEENDEAQTNVEIPDSPESPDESMSSDVFVVEEAISNEGSISSSKVAEYLEKVHQEDSSSYFVTSLGTPRKINFAPASPLNDLEVRHSFGDSEDNETRFPPQMFLPRQTDVFPRGVALSQPAPGLGCHCRRVGIGRGHGCSLRFPKWYFNY